MAQPLRCDQHDQEHEADVLVTRTADGSTVALCDPAFVGLCRVIVEEYDRRLDAATAAGVDDLEAAATPDDLEAAITDAEAERRLRGVTSPEAEALGVATVVRRGTSRSRREHERRRRERERDEADVEPEAEPPSPPA